MWRGKKGGKALPVCQPALIEAVRLVSSFCCSTRSLLREQPIDANRNSGCMQVLVSLLYYCARVLAVICSLVRGLGLTLPPHSHKKSA